MTAQPDLINQLLGLADGAPLAALRLQRPEAVKAIEASRVALFAPDVGGLTLAERAAVALRVAVMEADAVLAKSYRARLAAQPGAPDAAAVEAGSADPRLTPRLAAMLEHAERLVLEPIAAEPAHLQALAAVGLSPRAIVVLSQLIAFVTFETRLLAGLRLLGA